MIDEGIIFFYFTQNESKLIDKFNIKIVLIEEGFRCLFIKPQQNIDYESSYYLSHKK